MEITALEAILFHYKAYQIGWNEILTFDTILIVLEAKKKLWFRNYLR